MDNIFGIIGGMGPMATELFYKMLIEKTDAPCDQDHLNTIIIGHATMPDRTSAILSGDEAKIKEICDLILADAKTLENLGCRAIGVTCNTAHYFIDKIADQVGIPFIHLIRETAAEAARLAPKQKIGILATYGTIKTGLYQDALIAEGLEPVVLDEEGQEIVMSEIYDCVKAGKPADMDKWAVVDEKLRELGCSKALLACTELSVIKADENLPDFYIDPMEVTADRALEFMGVKKK